MLKHEELVMKKGMDCLTKHLDIIEVELFISAIIKSTYDYTGWRQEYFENAYQAKGRSQLENFLNAAAGNDPKGASFGLA